MEKITVGEFNQHISKYLKPGKYILTKHGKEVFTVTVEYYKPEVPEVKLGDSLEPTNQKECAFPTCKGLVYKDKVCKEHWDRHCKEYKEFCHCGKKVYFGDLCGEHYTEALSGIKPTPLPNKQP